MDNVEIKIPEPTVTIFRGDKKPQSKYTSLERGWQAISTIEVTGKRLWASWMAGGVTEPDPNNYINLAYSDDGGKTWVDPFIVIDNENPLSRGRDPILWLDPNGVLWFYYGYYALKYTYAIKILNPEAPINEVVISDPVVKFTDGVIINKPIVTSTGKWLCMFDPRMEDKLTNYCLESKDFGETWEKIGELKSSSAHKDWQEGHLVEKKDGTLWAMLRIESAFNGGIEQCFSKDNGVTWTHAESNLSYPFYGPGSKFCFLKTKSNNIVFVNNNSNEKVRRNMSAYYSNDDGKTWKALLIDYRNGCAYPDITQDKDGYIYVIFDCDRESKHEIRFSKFTEEDLLKEEFNNFNSIKMFAISKDGKYSDIVNIKKIENNIAYVIDEKNREFLLTGVFSEKTINGIRYTYFNAEEEMKNYFLTDSKGLLLSK